MKKKLNLLWNLKFNFFSVAERPLTFFAYFLNAKKVGRRRLVIGPAKAGAFLFSHTRLPLSPRWGRRPASAVPPQAKWSRTATSAGVLPLGPRRAPGQRGRPQPSSASSPFSLSSPSSSSMGCHACPNFTSLKSAVSPVICLRRRSSSLSMPRCFAIHASERPSS